MLILVGVTINVALNGGLFETASSAAKDTQKEADKEELQAAVAGAYDAIEGTVDGTKLALNLPEWTVEGNGPFTCTSPKANKFKVTVEGIVEDYVELNLSALEKYILGEEGTGTNFEEIFNLKNFSFKNVPAELEENGGLNPISYSLISTEVITSTDSEGNTTEETGITLDFYFEYDENKYKFRALVDEEGVKGTTLADVGVVKLTYDESTKVGKYVQYDEKNWIVLYDDAINGLQMISAEALLDNGNEICLGYDDKSFTEDEVIEIDGVEGKSNLEKAMYSYNNAITTLNEKCTELVIDKSKVARDESGNYKIRSVGSNPITPNTDTTSSFIGTNKTIPQYGTSTWFEDNLNLQKNIGERTYYTIKGTETEYTIKNTDSNYMNDFDRMVTLGINQGLDSNRETEDYWLASRVVGAYSSYVGFDMRCVHEGLGLNLYLWYVEPSKAYDNYDNFAVRPVVSLESGVLDSVAGEGTSTSPYILD